MLQKTSVLFIDLIRLAFRELRKVSPVTALSDVIVSGVSLTVGSSPLDVRGDVRRKTVRFIAYKSMVNLSLHTP